MKKNLNIFIVITASLVLIASIFFLLFNKSQGGKPGFNNKKYVALVGKERIKREDFEKELSRKKHFFNWAKQEVGLFSLENDVVEALVDFELVSQYAQSKSITVSDEEINERFNQIIQGSGESEEKLLNKIFEMYGMNKAGYIEVLKKDILKEKVQESLGKPLSDWLGEQRKTVNIVR